MRTIGIWITGLLASALIGGFIGSTSDTVWGDGRGSIAGGACWPARLHLRPPLADWRAKVVKHALEAFGRIVAAMIERPRSKPRGQSQLIAASRRPGQS